MKGRKEEKGNQCSEESSCSPGCCQGSGQGSGVPLCQYPKSCSAVVWECMSLALLSKGGGGQQPRMLPRPAAGVRCSWCESQFPVPESPAAPWELRPSQCAVLPLASYTSFMFAQLCGSLPLWYRQNAGPRLMCILGGTLPRGSPLVPIVMAASGCMLERTLKHAV